MKPEPLGVGPGRVGRRLSESTRGAWPICGLAALALTFLWEIWVSGAVPVARDMQLYFAPIDRLVWNAIRTGEAYLWTPLMGTGSPLLANIQTGFFYPPTWLFAVLPFLRGFGLLLVLHVVLAGLGMYAFCRRIGFTGSSAFLAAVAYMLGGYFTSLTNMTTILQVSAWLPLQCLTVVHYMEGRSLASFLAAVGVFLMSLLAGAPLTFLLGSCIAFVFCTLRIGLGAENRGRSLLSLLGSMTVVAVLVTGLSMVQLLPMAEYVRESIRASGLSFELATRYSLEPLRILELVIPPSFEDPTYRFGKKASLTSADPWLFSVYLGTSVLLLAAIGVAHRRRRIEMLFWTALALLGLVLSLGGSLPVYGWLYEWVPGLAAFRYPERFFVLTGFSIPVLAAHGLDCLRENRGCGRAALVLTGLGLVVGFSLRLYWNADSERVHQLASAHLSDRPFLENFDYAHGVLTGQLDHALVFLFLAGISVFVYRRGWVRGKPFVLALLGVASVDLWLAHRHLTPVVDQSFYEATPAVMELLPSEEMRLTYRYRATPFDENIDQFMTLPGLPLEASKWLWQQTLHPNMGAYHGVLTHDSGDAIHLRRQSDQTQFLRILPQRDRWRLLRLGSVKYVYSMEGLDQDAWSDRVALDTLPGWIYAVRDPVPRAYIAYSPLIFDTELKALNAAIHPDFDPARNVALVSSEAADPQGGSDAPRGGADAAAVDRVRITSDIGSEVRIEVSAQDGGYLVLTDTYYPGWRARVDGEERPILQANYFYRAVPIGPGDHEVVFRYEPRSFALGLRISLATLGLLLLGVLAFCLGSRLPKQSKPPLRRHTNFTTH